MNYRSLADLSRTVIANLHRLPHDVDCIVGIPRSGLLAANIIALHLNKPLLDLDSYISGARGRVGRTVAHTMGDISGPYRKVLIVDDSVASGRSISEVLDLLNNIDVPAENVVCVVYGTRSYHEGVDLVLEQVPNPRVFEWNLMRHPVIEDACLDIDGVLCHDPAPKQNDDGPNYKDFIANAKRLYIPGVKVPHLVTSRLERYRAETEGWLKQSNIDYGKLWMLDLPTAEARRKANAHASFKAEVYLKTGAALFIESEDEQAMEIAQLSGRPVLSIAGQRMIHPGTSRLSVGGSRSTMKHAYRRPYGVRLIVGILGERRWSALKQLLRGFVRTVS